MDFSSFVNAAKALTTGVLSSGFTGNGLKQLHFKVNQRTYTAIEQNHDKLSIPAKLAREGHSVVQIKDVDAGKLIGDVVDGKFNSYDTTIEPVDIETINAAVAGK